MTRCSASAFVLIYCLEAAGQIACAATNEWPSYNGDLNSDRFSSLTEITPKNAADLREVCEASLGDEGSFQPGPLMIGDSLFITTVHTVVALSATDCTVRWRYVYKMQEDEVLPGNRGVAYMDGKLFRGTADGRVLAIDSRTGKELWRVKSADTKIFEFFSAAPIAWNGLVYLGPGGADYGIRGRMTAFDAASGKEVWRFNTIPLKGEPGYETWRIPDTAEHGGGGTWSSYTLDTATGELFISVANPAPDLTANTRPGDNLYTDSLLVLDAKTGALKWYYQFTPNDTFDYDVAAAPALYTDREGKRRVAVGSKDGYLYILDRDSHKLISKTAVTTIKTPPGPPTVAGVYACPGTTGGVDWNGPAYSPESNILYVGSVDWCTYFSTVIPAYPVSWKTGKSKTGWVYAVNASTGKPVWHYHAESPVLSGVTPTAGGVLFSGESSGDFLVLNARNGKLIKKQNLGGSMGGGIITYSIAGKQYVATTAGNVSRSGLATGADNAPRVIIMTLGLDSAYQPVKIAAVPPEEANRGFGIDQSKVKYNAFCAACHGPEGRGGEGGPSLQNESSRKDFAAVVAWIKNPAPPMPKLVPPMTNSEVEAVARYIEQFK
jgi:alcohol dehydrogenase (cytochrome c)